MSIHGFLTHFVCFIRLSLSLSISNWNDSIDSVAWKDDRFCSIQRKSYFTDLNLLVHDLIYILNLFLFYYYINLFYLFYCLNIVIPVQRKLGAASLCLSTSAWAKPWRSCNSWITTTSTSNKTKRLASISNWSEVARATLKTIIFLHLMCN